MNGGTEAGLFIKEAVAEVRERRPWDKQGYQWGRQHLEEPKENRALP